MCVRQYGGERFQRHCSTCLNLDMCVLDSFRHTHSLTVHHTPHVKAVHFSGDASFLLLEADLLVPASLRGDVTRWQDNQAPWLKCCYSADWLDWWFYCWLADDSSWIQEAFRVCVELIWSWCHNRRDRRCIIYYKYSTMCHIYIFFLSNEGVKHAIRKKSF